MSAGFGRTPLGFFRFESLPSPGPRPPFPPTPPIPPIPSLPVFNPLPWPRPWKIPVAIPTPRVIKIALYVEGGIRFDGGGFLGLKVVIETLKNFTSLKTNFDVHLFDREAGINEIQSVQGIPINFGKTILDIGLNSNGFDELWLFGLTPGGSISPGEINEIHRFMDAGGGVLTTGDHADLGRFLSGSIKRVGKMRKYPAGAAAPGLWYSTLRSGADQFYDFNDQSDAQGQPVVFPSLPQYPGGIHPLMRTGSGAISTFPDHQHEGEAISPTNYPQAEWPISISGFQPRVEIVATGSMIDPSVSQPDMNRPLGLVAVYDGHRVASGRFSIGAVGRIVADSTWHHWFDINLIGFIPNSNEYRDIRDYIINVGLWLDRPKGRFIRFVNVTSAALRIEPLIMLDTNKMSNLELGSVIFKSMSRFWPASMLQDDMQVMIESEIGAEVLNMRQEVLNNEWFGSAFPFDAIMLGSITKMISKSGLLDAGPNGDFSALREKVDKMADALPNACATQFIKDLDESIKSMTAPLMKMMSKVKRARQ